MKMRRARSGYSLLEILACIALLAALFPSASKLYVSITRLHAAESAALDRVLAFNDFEHDFRAAVESAVAVEPSIGKFTTAGPTVALRTREGHVVFTVDDKGQPRRILFRARPAGGWMQRIVSYALPRWRCRFEAAQDGAGVHFYARPVPQPGATRASLPARVHILTALRAVPMAEEPKP